MGNQVVPFVFANGAGSLDDAFRRQLDTNFGIAAPIIDARVYGVVGDGVTDNGPVLTWLNSLGVAYRLPLGIINCSQRQRPAHGTLVYGSGGWGSLSTNTQDQNTTRVVYTGAAGGAETDIFWLFSDAAAGVLPVGATRDMANCGMRDLILDGNGLIAKCFEGVRLSGPNFLNVTTIGSTLRGSTWLLCFSMTVINWFSREDQGQGQCWGRNIYTWAGGLGAATTDQCTFIQCGAYFVGCDRTGAPLNQFTDGLVAPFVVNDELEAGLIIFGARDLKFIGLWANQCSGAGLIVDTFLQCPIFVGGYFEGNGRSSGSTAQYDIVVKADPGGNTQYLDFDSTVLGLTPTIWLQGSAAGVSRVEASVRFNRMPFLGTIRCSWTVGNYQAISSDRNVVYSATQPSNFSQQVNGARNLAASGVVRFDATSGAIVLKSGPSGCISGVVRNAAGDYTATISEVIAGATYTPLVTTSDGFVCHQKLPVSSTNINVLNRPIAGGAAVDTGAVISIMIFLDYTSR